LGVIRLIKEFVPVVRGLGLEPNVGMLIEPVAVSKTLDI